MSSIKNINDINENILQQLKEKIVKYIAQTYNKSDENATQALHHFEKKIFDDIIIIKKQTGLNIIEAYNLYENNNYHLDNSMVCFYEPDYVKNIEKECMDEYEALPEIQKKIKHFNHIMDKKNEKYEFVQSQKEMQTEQAQAQAQAQAQSSVPFPKTILATTHELETDEVSV
jgi:hypothetical protein